MTNIRFDLETARNFHSQLQKFKEELTEEWQTSTHQWGNLQASWQDVSRVDFETHFSKILDSQRVIIANLERHIAAIEQKIAIAEKLNRTLVNLSDISLLTPRPESRQNPPVPGIHENDDSQIAQASENLNSCQVSLNQFLKNLKSSIYNSAQGLFITLELLSILLSIHSLYVSQFEKFFDFQTPIFSSVSKSIDETLGNDQLDESLKSQVDTLDAILGINEKKREDELEEEADSIGRYRSQTSNSQMI